MKLNKRDIEKNYRQSKSRERPRSTYFDTDIQKEQRRTKGRMNTKKEIDDTLENELEENEGLDNYLNEYFED